MARLLKKPVRLGSAQWARSRAVRHPVEVVDGSAQRALVGGVTQVGDGAPERRAGQLATLTQADVLPCGAIRQADQLVLELRHLLDIRYRQHAG